MILLLTILTAVAVLILVVALVVYLVQIGDGLLDIGGFETSYLAKINFGVRAIEKETSALTPQVTQLNEGLTAVAAGLRAIDQSLVATIEAVSRQETYKP
jgi:hypothetical protein